MKKTLYILLIFIIGLFLISCNKQDNINNKGEDPISNNEGDPVNNNDGEPNNEGDPVNNGEEEPKPFINGKKLVVFGDSITALGSWGKATADELKMYFYNAAMGGITFLSSTNSQSILLTFFTL